MVLKKEWEEEVENKEIKTIQTNKNQLQYFTKAKIKDI